jgi:hypothetical protein
MEDESILSFIVLFSLPLVGSNKDDDTLSVSSPSRGRKI